MNSSVGVGAASWGCAGGLVDGHDMSPETDGERLTTAVLDPKWSCVDGLGLCEVRHGGHDTTSRHRAEAASTAPGVGELLEPAPQDTDGQCRTDVGGFRRLLRPR